MRKVIALIALLILGVNSWSQTLAPFTYKLLPTNDPQGQSNVQFICQLPPSATNLSWDFGQGGGTSTEREPQFTYNVSSDIEFLVQLQFTLSGEAHTDTLTINASPAFFRVFPDPNFQQLASLKRVLRSAFMIETNDEASIGDMRFEWAIDGVRPTGNAFSGSSMGDYPNIYYTFPQGGSYDVTLKVHHSSNPASFAEYTRTVVLEPTVPTKLNFENLPQFISPNGDSVNDFFEVTSTGTSPLLFMVFSRTGTVLYQQEANVIRWDGTNYNGKDLPEGIYFYTIEDKGGLYNPAKGFFYIFRGN